MAYGAAADDENLLGYGPAKGAATPAPVPAPAPLAAPAENPLGGPAAPFSAERADLLLSFLRRAWAGCRPWAEFYSTSALSRPAFETLSERVRTNLEVFRDNYIIVATAWLGLGVLAGIPTFLLAGLLFFLLDKAATYRAAKNGGSLSHEDRIIAVVAALLVVWFTGIFGHVALSGFCTGVSVLAHAACHRQADAPVIEAV